MALGPAASASPRNLIEKHVLWSHARPAELESVRMGPVICVLGYPCVSDTWLDRSKNRQKKKGKNTAIDGANRKNNRVDFNSVNIENYVE